ncbi:MAG: hypothetical protein AAFY72_09065 [Cyanobacteria bacterium J06649_4]
MSAGASSCLDQFERFKPASAQCPEKAPTLSEKNVEEVSLLDNESNTYANQASATESVGYLFEAGDGDEISYSLPEGTCIWLLSPRGETIASHDQLESSAGSASHLIETSGLGVYVVRVSAISENPLEFDLRLSLDIGDIGTYDVFNVNNFTPIYDSTADGGRYLGCLPKGTTGVAVTGRSQTIQNVGWLPVEYAGTSGWAKAARLQKVDSKLPTAESPEDSNLQADYVVSDVRADDVLYVLTGAGTDNSIVGCLPYDATGVSITGDSVDVGGEDWVLAKAKAPRGWVNTKFLRASGDRYNVFNVKNYLPTRSRAGTSNRALGCIPPNGENVETLGSARKTNKGTWALVQYPVSQAWIRASSLEENTRDTFEITNVADGDVLYGRRNPGSDSTISNCFLHNAEDIQIEERRRINVAEWVPIQYRDVKGWAEKKYLTKK